MRRIDTLPVHTAHFPCITNMLGLRRGSPTISSNQFGQRSAQAFLHRSPIVSHTHTHWHTHTHIHIYIHDIYIYLYTYIWHRLFFQHLHTQLVNTWPFKLLSNPYKTIPPICLCVKVFVHLVFVTNLLVRWFWRKQPDVPSPFGHFLVGSRFALPVQAGRSTVTLPKKARCQLKF